MSKHTLGSSLLDMTKRDSSSIYNDNFYDVINSNKRIYSNSNNNEQNVNPNINDNTEELMHNINDYNIIQHTNHHSCIENIATDNIYTSINIFSHIDRKMIAKCLHEIYKNPSIGTWEESCIVSGIMNRFKIPYEHKDSFRHLLIDIYYKS